MQEWMRGVARTHRLAPRSGLAALLHEGERDESLRPFLSPLLGQCGVWLARQNPDWAYAAGTADMPTESVWETGALAERIEYLRRLRASDPAAARERLRLTWTQEPADTRAKFLETFKIGLSADDEAFLETALDDRGKLVRLAAAQHLSCLPGSGLARRMAERVGRYVRIEKKLLGGRKMTVELPEGIDAIARRDGLEESKGKKEDFGPKASLLRQMIALTPLERWTADNGLTPAESIELARKTDWSAAIVGGWAEAAKRQREGNWLLVLIRYHDRKYREFTKEEMLLALAPSDFAGLLKEMIVSKKDLVNLETISGALHAGDDLLLDNELTRLILQRMSSAYLDFYTSNFMRDQFLIEVALRGDPCCYPQAIEAARTAIEKKPEWQKVFDQFLSLYEFRHAMHKELSR